MNELKSLLEIKEIKVDAENNATINSKTVLEKVDACDLKYKEEKEASKEPKLATSIFLREQLRINGLSYRRLAALTGVNYNLISRVCNNGMVRADSFLKMCAYFNYSKKELLDIYEQGLKAYLILETLKEKKAAERAEKFIKGEKKDGN